MARFGVYSNPGGKVELRFADVVISHNPWKMSYEPLDRIDKALEKTGTVEIAEPTYDVLREFYTDCMKDPYNQTALEIFKEQASIAFDSKLKTEKPRRKGAVA